MDHVVDGPQDTVTGAESEPDLARVTITTDLRPARRCGSSSSSPTAGRAGARCRRCATRSTPRSPPPMRTGWDGLVAAQRAYLDDFWARADVELDGDPALQQAVRFALFHVLQAAARAEERAIPAKGLTGRGYDGHSFWDMETYTLPVLTYVAPRRRARRAAVAPLDARPGAGARAGAAASAGATFPWRTISGKECSGYWPAGTAAFHINADIADAVRRYVARHRRRATFERGAALELLVETARLWRSVGHHDADGRLPHRRRDRPRRVHRAGRQQRLHEPHGGAQPARRGRRRAPTTQRAAELGVDEEEIAAWRDAADAIVIPFDDELGVTPQSEGFTRYRHWDFARTPAEDYPLLLHYPYYLLYSSQVVKQADLVFALYVCGDHFSAEQKARDFEYYEAITVRDSSLSACVQAIVAAEVGHLDLAYDYLRETAFIDLRDLAFNTNDGLHLAALAGAWLVAVAGFGGMRDHGDTLRVRPAPARRR